LEVFAPVYYNSFKCIADKCRHSCCIGWDVEIDAVTLDTYTNIGGELGNKIKENIIYNDDIPCFKLNDKKRCPFLKENGLCEIILELGEENICDICTDHPRFRNYFSDRVEIGLGLCCEEVSRIILTEDYDLNLCCIEEISDEEEIPDEIEKYVLLVRDELFGIIKNSEYDYSKCRSGISRIIEREIPVFDNKDISEIYLPLEMLENSWGCLITDFSQRDFNMQEICEKYSNYSKRILNYFIFRHFSDAVYDGRICERAIFAILSTELILSLAYSLSDDKFDVNQLCEIARRYSSEIEYSDENIDKILDYIAKKSTE